MMADSIKRTLLPTVLLATVAIFLGAMSAHAATPPVKLIVASHFGREVNLTQVEAHAGPQLEDLCTVASSDACQPGVESSIPGGFVYPEGVAVNNDPAKASPHYGHVYVADTVNNRVQELTATGGFVSMFGGEVNETKTLEFNEPGNPHGIVEAEENVCTQEEITSSGVKCKAGVLGGRAGQIRDDYSITVDPASGDVYVQDLFNSRVDQYTADGEFVWMAGKEVNETKDNTPAASEAEKNLCTAASGDVCKAGVESATGPSAFAFAQGFGDLLAVGGPEDLLYVGDEHRVQELKADGTWVREIPLTSISAEPETATTALAVDESGDVYLANRVGLSPTGVVHEFASNGKQVNQFEVSPKEPNGEVAIQGMALDSSGRLAVTVSEFTGTSCSPCRTAGLLLTAATGHLITEFPVPPGPGTVPNYLPGIAFNSAGELYGASVLGHAVVRYVPELVGELVAGPASCKPAGEHETSVTLDCILNGEVNPWSVPETRVWFESGTTSALGSRLPEQEIPTGNTPVGVGGSVTGLRPNAPLYYRLAGHDEHVIAPELLTSETTLVDTPIVPAKIVGEPAVEFVHSSSTVMFAELNPENARTEAFFEYGSGTALESCPGVRKASCPGVAATPAAAFSEYHRIGATLEATGLQPGTLYHYRLATESENRGKTERQESTGPEASFTTAPAPVPQAQTGEASAVGASTATISGSVNPDGQPATYAFELGVYAGAATQYGVVLSGSAGAATTPVGETLALSGLQPGTTYAYRIRVASGYGESVGATATFTTAGLPDVLAVPAVLAQLPIPSIAFPNVGAAPGHPAKVKCKRGYTRNRTGKCVKARRKARRSGKGARRRRR